MTGTRCLCYIIGVGKGKGRHGQTPISKHFRLSSLVYILSIWEEERGSKNGAEVDKKRGYQAIYWSVQWTF